MDNPNQEQNGQNEQVEFFHDLAGMAKKPKKKRFVLGKVAVSLSYENLLVLAIGLIMLLIVCYSLGVENGKQFSQINSEVPQDKQRQQVPEQQVQQQKLEEPKTQAPKPKRKLKLRVAKNTPPAAAGSPAYIQVASFRTDKYANREIERLKNSGHRAFVSRWGQYRVVCVGGYQDEAEAARAFTELKKVYADCILHNK